MNTFRLLYHYSLFSLIAAYKDFYNGEHSMGVASGSQYKRLGFLKKVRTTTVLERFCPSRYYEYTFANAKD